MRVQRRNIFTIAMFLIIAVMCVTLLCVSLSTKAAEAADGFNKDGEITIAHISDTHYYSFRLCYTDGDPLADSDALNGDD